MGGAGLQCWFVFFVWLFLLQAATAVLVLDSACPFGNNFIQVVAFTTIPDEERIANPTWDGEFGVEGNWHIEAFSFWHEQVNRVGINTSNGVYCVNMTFVNIGSGFDPLPTGVLRTTVRAWASNGHFFFAPFGDMALPVVTELEIWSKTSLVVSNAAPGLYRCFPGFLALQPECATKPPSGKRFRFTWGVQPASTAIAYPPLTLTYRLGARTLGFLSENNTYSTGISSTAQLYAPQQGMVTKADITLPRKFKKSHMLDAVAQLKLHDPDVVIFGSSTPRSCIEFQDALYAHQWTPKAAFLTGCGALPGVESFAPHAKYFLDWISWDPRLKGFQYYDTYYWPTRPDKTSPEQMNEAWWKKFQKPVNPITANAFAAGVLIHHVVDGMKGIIGANTSIIASEHMKVANIWSAAGAVQFSPWGQNLARLETLIQLNKGFGVDIIDPVVSATANIVYPIPTFKERRMNILYMSQLAEVIVVSFGALGIAVSIICIAFTYINRKSKVMTAASPTFLYIMLLGSILLYLTVFSWTLEATTATCHLRYWLLGMGFILTFGSLYAKTFRIMKIFEETNYRLLKITDPHLLIGLGILITIEAILLAVYSGYSNTHQVTYVKDPERPVYNEYRCQETRNDLGIMIALLVYNSLLLVFGMWLSIRVWPIKAGIFNESRPIAFSIYNIFAFGVIALGLQLSDNLNQRTMFIVRSVCIITATFTTVVAIYVHKIIHIRSDQSSFRTTSTEMTEGSVAYSTGNLASLDPPNSQFHSDSTANTASPSEISWKDRFDHLSERYEVLLRERGKADTQ